MGRLSRAGPVLVAAVVLGVAVVVGCTEESPRQRSPQAARGDAEIGRQLIGSYGCGTCHEIPGVRGADGLVGPPLDGMGERIFIAGRLANNQANMIRWITDPLDVDPETAMPDVGVTEDEAIHMSAYLSGLEG